MGDREVLMTLPGQLEEVLNQVCLVNYNRPAGTQFFAYFTQSLGAALLMHDGPVQELATMQTTGPSRHGSDRVDRWIYTQSYLMLHVVGPHAHHLKQSIYGAVKAAHDQLPEGIRSRVPIAQGHEGGPLEHVWEEDTETGLVWSHPFADLAEPDQLHLPVYAIAPDEFIAQCLVALGQPWMQQAYQRTPARSYPQERAGWLRANTADACLLCLAEQMESATEATYGMGLDELYNPAHRDYRIEVANDVCTPILRTHWLGRRHHRAVRFVLQRWQVIDEHYRRSPTFHRMEESTHDLMHLWAERAMPALFIMYETLRFLKDNDDRHLEEAQEAAWEEVAECYHTLGEMRVEDAEDEEMSE